MGEEKISYEESKEALMDLLDGSLLIECGKNSESPLLKDSNRLKKNLLS